MSRSGADNGVVAASLVHHLLSTYLSPDLASEWIHKRPGTSGASTEEDRMDWRHSAACRDEEPELFFPIGNTGPALQQIDEAKRVCQACDVQEPCLNWAIESGQDAGVWGGLSEDERRSLKRRRARERARMA